MDYLSRHEEIGFCFLDGDEDVYEKCYELIIPKLVPGGLLVAYNTISHADKLERFLMLALSDKRVDAVIVPIDKEELFCRRL